MMHNHGMNISLCFCRGILLCSPLPAILGFIFFIQTHCLFQKSNPSLMLIYEMLYGRRTFFFAQFAMQAII